MLCSADTVNELVDPVAAYLINEVSQSKLRIEKGKEKIDMCEAIEGIKEDARKDGSEARAKEISIRMYEKGVSVADISQYADESEETIRNWIAEAVIA